MGDAINHEESIRFRAVDDSTQRFVL